MNRKTPVYLTRDLARSLVSAAESDVVLGMAQPWLPDLIRVALGIGFRRDEGRVYARGYVLKGPDGEVLFEHRTKSGHDRAVPLLPLAREVLERLNAARTNEDEDATVFVGYRGTPLHGNFVGEEFRDQRSCAGLPKRFTFHTLRHTFASWLVTQGVPLRHVQAYLGHVSIQTTEIYAHLVEDRAHEVAAAAMADL